MNRTITAWILGLVCLSGALLTSIVLVRSDGAPLLASLPRERSLFAYSALLLLFPLLTLPWVCRRCESRPRAAAILALNSLCFVAVPMAFCAYVSAVSLHGLFGAAAMVAAAAAVPLVLQRFVPAHAGRISGALATVIIVTPMAALMAQSQRADALAAALRALSPLDWLQRIALQRELIPWQPFVLLAAVLWLAALAPRLRAAAPAALLGVLLLPTQAPQLTSLCGGVARLGARTAVSLRAPQGGMPCELSSGSGALAFTGDGFEHAMLLSPSAAQDHLTLRAGRSSQRITAPWRLVPRDVALVGALNERTGADSVVDARALRLGAGALEAFDTLLLDAAQWQALDPESASVLLAAADAGAQLWIEQAAADADTARGSGRVKRTRGAATLQPQWRAWRRPALGSVDREFLDVLVPLDWQELDLSAVFWFVLAYHLAFLLAFLLPLLLDAHKAPGVYLASVSFVVIVISAGGYQVLKQIFLRDNQVYTQSISLLVTPPPGDDTTADSALRPLLLRRFVAYASMSEEQRIVEFPRSAQVSLVSGTHALQEPLQLEAGEHQRWRLDLNRRQDKVLARVDSREQAPFTFTAQPDGSLLIKRQESAGATAGAEVRGALLIENGLVVSAFKVDGERLIPAADSGFFAAGIEGPFRKLQGRHGVTMQRYLLVALSGVARADLDSGWLEERDLGCFWMVPMTGR